MPRRFLIIAFASCLAGSAAPAAEMAMHHGKASSPAEAANAAAMSAMMKSMVVRPSGNPDKDFARMMLAHHQGAIAMAKVELQYGKDAELRSLAGDIVAAQEKEIAQMQAWLAAH